MHMVSPRPKAVFDTHMPLMGATWDEHEELWHYAGEPVEIIMVIRSDLPPFPEAGHYVADQLEAMGFGVTCLVKPLLDAMANWFRGDPADGLFRVATGEPHGVRRKEFTLPNNEVCHGSEV